MVCVCVLSTKRFEYRKQAGFGLIKIRLILLIENEFCCFIVYPPTLISPRPSPLPVFFSVFFISIFYRGKWMFRMDVIEFENDIN